MEPTPTQLTGHLLIAMPQMTDRRFSRSVVYMVEHTSDGAMGLIVNKPFPDLTIKKVMEKMSPAIAEACVDQLMFFGGPVSPHRGFVLHSDEYHKDGACQRLGSGFALSSSQYVLEQVALGLGPQRACVTLGYSGWGAGQLDGEIAANGWLTCPADPTLVFDTEPGLIWERSLAKLGVSALLLSSDAGTA